MAVMAIDHADRDKICKGEQESKASYLCILEMAQ